MRKSKARTLMPRQLNQPKLSAICGTVKAKRPSKGFSNNTNTTKCKLLTRKRSTRRSMEKLKERKEESPENDHCDFDRLLASDKHNFLDQLFAFQLFALTLLVLLKIIIYCRLLERLSVINHPPSSNYSKIAKDKKCARQKIQKKIEKSQEIDFEKSFAQQTIKLSQKQLTNLGQRVYRKKFIKENQLKKQANLCTKAE